MTAICIIVGIVVFFWGIFRFSVTVYVEQREELSVRVGAMGFKVWVINPGESKVKEEKVDKAKEKDKKEENGGDGEKVGKKKGSSGIKKLIGEKLSIGGDGKRSMGELVELGMGIMKAVMPPVGDVLRHIRITSVRVNVSVGAEDADEVAYMYTAVSTGVYSVLAVLRENIIVKVKKIQLNADFISGEVREDISFKVKIRISVILYNILRMGLRYLKTVNVKG